MSMNRRAKFPSGPTPTEPPLGERAARVQAALDAGGLPVKVDEAGEFDARAFAEATLARWPKVMKKLGE